MSIKRKIIKHRIKTIFFLVFKLLVLSFRFLRHKRYKEVFSPKDIKRILFIRLDRIGDMVLSTPALHALRKAYPEACISVLVNPYIKDIITGSPSVDEIIVYDDKREQKSFSARIRFIWRLRKKRFDLVIDPYTGSALTSGLIAYFSAVRVRVGYDMERKGFLYTIKLASDFAKKHMVGIILDTVKPIGVDAKIEDAKLEVCVEPQSRKYVEGLLTESGVCNSDVIIGIHPGAFKKEPTKRWKIKGFAQLIDLLNKMRNVKVIIMGGNADQEFCEEIIRHTNSKPITMVGKTKLSQLIALIEKCHLFISNNTGPLHIAVALKVPTVSIMGPSIPERWQPWGGKGKHIIIRKELPCSPCNFYKCKRGDYACMELITADEVLEAVKMQMKEIRK